MSGPPPSRRRSRSAARGGTPWTATRASSCSPSGARRRSSRCARRACSSSARARSARPSRPTWWAPASGRLGIVDSDDVEVSNLHRQPLHFTPDVGVAKAHSAAAKLRFLNPDVVVEPYQARFAPPMLEGADLVVDCSDSFDTRYEVNAACCAARIPLVEGGVVGLAGLVMAIRPGVSACYRCAFPEPPPPGSAPSCAEAGVLGPAAGVIGSLQALEALKLLAGLEGALLDAFLQVDLHDHAFLRVTTSRRADCPDCATL